MRLAQLWQNFQQAKISIEKLSDILNNPAENTETLSKGSMPEIKGDVEFKDITFRYVPNGPEILKKMNFKVRAGQKIGFVGPSGSGKSTVTKLIQRLYIPESGKVLIDGIDISTVDTAWLRRQIGVVLQENYLFNKSVRENIALTNPAISMDRIIAAARLAVRTILLPNSPTVMTRLLKNAAHRYPADSGSGLRLLALWSTIRGFDF